VVGLRGGELVFDGAPSDLSPDILTSIYGEEDWSVVEDKDEEIEEDTPAPAGVDIAGAHP